MSVINTQDFLDTFQDDEDAFLEQAIALSMAPTSNDTTRDINMSEATSDKELASGE